jgi:hypothetical protein
MMSAVLTFPGNSVNDPRRITYCGGKPSPACAASRQGGFAYYGP